jgi:S1-C subfamily serine protease
LEDVYMALIPPTFLDAVVAIGTPDKQGKPVWIASGFLYGRFTGEEVEGKKAYEIFLVTNRHVLEGKTNIFLRFNPIEGQQAKEYLLDTSMPDGSPAWQAHENSDIDISLAQINGQQLQREGIQFSFFQSDHHCAGRDKLMKLGVTEGDYAYVLGFPMGLIGEGRNFVIVRNGVIARIRDTLARESNEFLLDAFIFPGNSGGPVVLKPEIIAIGGTRSQSAAYLIGVVTGYLPYRDVAISQQTYQPRIIFEENSGLAAVHPIDFIEEIISKLKRGAKPEGPIPA